MVYLSTQSGGKTYSGDDVARITSHLRKVSVNPTTTFRGPITMGDPEKYPDEAIKFEIFLYNKTTEMKPPSAKKLSAISYDEDADGDSGKVDLVKSYKVKKYIFVLFYLNLFFLISLLTQQKSMENKKMSKLTVKN